MILIAPLLLAALCAPQGNAAQRPTDVATAVHEAWLCEVLDLDIAGAVRRYQAIAAGDRPGQPERWIAIARLGELRRLGVDAGPEPPLTGMPAALQPAFDRLAEPLPVGDLLRQASPPGQIGTEALRPPPLRPATAAVLEWVRSQIGPSTDDRMRQRLQAQRVRRSDTRRVTERLYAADILRVELQGRPGQAQALRALYFADWRPPALAADSGTQWSEARLRLAGWLEEADLPAQQAVLLRGLKERLEQLASTDPREALAMIARMPIYADRLLGSNGR